MSVASALATGPRLVQDLNPGRASSQPYSPVAFGNRLVFFANLDRWFSSPTYELGEVWTTGGADETTARLATVRWPAAEFFGVAPSLTAGVMAYADERFALFRATTATEGAELWTSDGTPAGTRLLRNLMPEPLVSAPRDFVRVGDRVYFLIGSPSVAVAVTDGTAEGTLRLPPEAAPATGSRDFVGAIGDWLIYLDKPGSGSWRLMRTDGTAQGAVELATQIPNYLNDFTDRATVARGVVYFARSMFPPEPLGVELWRSDGTAAGTSLVLDATPPLTPDGAPSELTAVGDRVFYTFNTSIPSTVRPGYTLLGRELWVSDGTAAGTRLVKDITPGSGSSVLTSLTPFGDRLLFVVAPSGGSRSLWISDGTEAGTAPIPMPASPVGFNGQPPRMVAARGRAFFAVSETGTGVQLWSTDGTGPGTRRETGGTSGFADNGWVMPVNSRVYFTGRDAEHGVEPWVIDLCPADFDNSGTETVVDIFAFLSDWFAQRPHGDFDASGSQDVADVFAFLSAWFSPCPG